MSLAKIVAALGESADFVAFQAHCWFAFALVYYTVGHGTSLWWTAGFAAVAALLKEWWFDATQEKNPPQTFADNALDSLGYLTGIGLAIAALLT